MQYSLNYMNTYLFSQSLLIYFTHSEFLTLALSVSFSWKLTDNKSHLSRTFLSILVYLSNVVAKTISILSLITISLSLFYMSLGSDYDWYYCYLYAA